MNTDSVDTLACATPVSKLGETVRISPLPHHHEVCQGLSQATDPGQGDRRYQAGDRPVFYREEESTTMVRVLERITRFYYAESCGQCTPCREGTGWMYRLLQRLLAGDAGPEHIVDLVDIADRIEGRTICAFGDAAAWPVQSFLKHFRPEFEAMARVNVDPVAGGIAA